MEKRQPTLADRFVARRFAPHERLLHPKAIEQMQRATRNARKFVFDEDAARRIARVVLDLPDLLVREHRFARAPYDITWIEWPSWAYWQVLRDDDPTRYDAQGTFGMLETSDHTVGYLIDHDRVNTVSCGTFLEPDGLPFVTPLQYRLHTEWPVDEQIEFSRLSGYSRSRFDAIMWGSSYDNLAPDAQRLLRAYNVIERVPVNPRHPQVADLLTKDGSLAPSVRGAVGDVRTLIAMLLMLNRPSITRYVNTLPNHRGFVRGKLQPFMSHTTVSVSLDAAQTLRLIGTLAGETVEQRRRHEVRGHFCHDETARNYMRIAGCIHEWQDCDEKWTPWLNAPPREVHHWCCTACSGKRWWRRDHDRGNAEVGFVAKDGYEVTV